MEEDWKTYKLGDLIEINTNTIKKGQTKWIHYIDIKSVGSGTYVDPKRIQFDDAPSRARRLLLEGDTVISSVRPNLKSYFYSQNLKNFTIASTGFAVLSPRKIDSRFLYYLTTNDRYIDFLVKSCTGSAYPAFGPNVIVESEVTIPRSVPEQHAIASILSALDDKIELNLQMNKTLEEMAMTLYKHWFVDFGPFKDGEFVSSELGEIPKGWEVARFGELISSRKSNRTVNAISENDKYIGLEHIDKGSLSLLKFGSGLDVSSNKSGFLKGDILFGKLRPYFKKVGIAPFDGICSTDILVITPKHARDFGYVLMTIFSDRFIDYATTVSGGTRMPRVNWSDIQDYKIVIQKSRDLSTKFTEVVNLFVEQIFANINEYQILTSMRDVLLPKLISGEVRVKDAAKTIAEAL